MSHHHSSPTTYLHMVRLRRRCFYLNPGVNLKVPKIQKNAKRLRNFKFQLKYDLRVQGDKGKIKFVYLCISYIFMYKHQSIMDYESPESVGVEHLMIDNTNLQHQASQDYSAQPMQADFEVSGQYQLKAILCALLKSSDEYQLVKTTKFLAHQYLLKFLQRFPEYQNTDAQLLMITSLRLAVKFNQNTQISDGYTVACCVSQCQGKYSDQQFIDFELFMMKILNYKLSIRSPYDYFDEVSENLDLTEHQKEIFEAHMDYILSLVEFKDCTPEELFVYCFNTMFIDCKIQNLKLFNYINSLLRKYSSAFEKASLIKEYIMRMDEEGDEMEEISQ